MTRFLPRRIHLAILIAAILPMTTAARAERHDPKPNPAAVVRAGDARFTFLTSALVRLEWSPTATFEDRASFAFVHRNTPAPKLEKRDEAGGWIAVETDDLILRYKPAKGAAGKFDASNLSIALKSGVAESPWRPGLVDEGNLGGTVRTLDGVSGATPLEPGLMSRDGWTLRDDSATLLFEDEGDPRWVGQRKEPGRALDWYFFGHGRDFKRARRDFALVAGSVPLPPRYVFGSWWSRYWAYTDQELRDLVAEFERHDVPLDVLVVDMDWHLDGWTGYTWSPKHFPDPDAFLEWTESKGLKTTLNLHPHDGVRDHEAQFAAMAAAMGLDPKTAKHVPFDPVDARYMRAYFDVLHRPEEKRGVDFWWIDWQQGEETKVPGLDPLFWLNYLHWEDMKRNAERGDLRPLIFSRWGGLGNHRYQIGFSGDTWCDWESLAFQPYFTATAANVGFDYWSHDIGGHQPGPVDPELYARWIQFGALSPILRTHTTKNPFAERRVWAFDDEIFRVSRDAFLLRQALLPYIYSTASQSWRESLPMVRPLYYEWPELEESYAWQHEYLFGDLMLAAPIAKPRDPMSGCALNRAWLPPGQWRHWFTGRVYEGPAEVGLMTPLERYPLFVREGALLPMAAKGHGAADAVANPLVIHAFAGQSGSFVLYEDDGLTNAHERGEFAETYLDLQRDGDIVEIAISAPKGGFEGFPAKRTYEIRLRGVWPLLSCEVDGQAAKYEYDAETFTAVVRAEYVPATQGVLARLRLAPDDDKPLRDGLHGEAALIAALDERRGELLRAELKRILPGQSGGANKPKAAVAAIEAHRAALEVELFRAAAGSFEKAGKLMRLLGVGAEIKAVAAEEGTVLLSGSLEMFRPARGLHVDIDFEAPKGWSPIGEQSAASARLSEGGRFEESAKFHPGAPGGVLQTAVTRSTVIISDAAGEASISVDGALFPSINGWKIVGPFDNPQGVGLGTIFPPEKGKIDFAAKYRGKNRAEIAWRDSVRKLDAGHDCRAEHYVDLQEFLDDKPWTNAVAYAAATLVAAEETEAVIALGSDDGVAAWLNGEEILRVETGRPYASKQDKVSIKLKKGENLLLLKISQAGGGWGFAAHVESPDGKTLKGVTVALPK